MELVTQKQRRYSIYIALIGRIIFE